MACRNQRRGLGHRLKVLGGVAMWLCSASNCFAELIASVGQVALGADIASFTLNATPGVELNGMFREARVRRFSLSFEGIAAARSPEVSYLVFINAKDA